MLTLSHLKKKGIRISVMYGSAMYSRNRWQEWPRAGIRIDLAPQQDTITHGDPEAPVLGAPVEPSPAQNDGQILGPVQPLGQPLARRFAARPHPGHRCGEIHLDRAGRYAEVRRAPRKMRDSGRFPQRLGWGATGVDASPAADPPQSGATRSPRRPAPRQERARPDRTQ